MTYEDFIAKWISKPLYTTPHDTQGKLSGKITMYRDNNYKLSHYPNNFIIADVFLIPYAINFKDILQRTRFFNDCKLVGVAHNKSTINEYYKIIDIIPK